MNADVRKKLDRIAGVRDFSRQHPSDDPSHLAAVAKLEELFGRAEAVSARQISGRAEELAAVQRRDEVREALQTHLLRHVVRYGELAARENPALIGKFRLPTIKVNHKSYLVAAKNIRTNALANRDALLRVGLSEPILTAFLESVDQLERAAEEVRLARVSHVGAGADLVAVSNELMELIERLDTFNRFRFKENPELAAAWNSIRRVPSLVRPKKPPADPKPGVSAA